MEMITIFNGKEVRILKDEKNEPWYFAEDAGKSLGYTRTRDSIKANVDNIYKCKLVDFKKYNPSVEIFFKRVHPHTILINTDGFVSLVSKSRKISNEKRIELMSYIINIFEESI